MPDNITTAKVTSVSLNPPLSGNPSASALLSPVQITNTPLSTSRVPLQRSSSFPGAQKTCHCPVASQPPRDKLAPLICRPDERGSLSPQALRYLENMLESRPDVVEQTFRGIVEIHSKTLQDAVGKAAFSSDDKATIKQALRHFLVKANPARLAALENKITQHQRLSYADKNNLLQQLHKIALSHVTIDAPQVGLSTLAAVLNRDVITMLVKFGLTAEQLKHFAYNSSMVNHLVEYNLLLVGSDNLSAKLQQLKTKAIVPANLNHARGIIREFELGMYTASHYLDWRLYTSMDDLRDVLSHLSDRDYPEENYDYLRPLESFSNPPIAGVSVEEVQRNRLIRILEINFFRGYLLLTLFREAKKHSPAMMERSVINPEQLKLTQYSDDAIKLGRMIKPTYSERADRLLAKMVVAPFIFGDSTQPPAMDLKQLSYSYRGLPVTTIDGWIHDTNISADRLELIGLYCNDRLVEISQTGKIHLWMAPFSDETLKLFFTKRDDLCEPLLGRHAFALARALRTIGEIIITEDYDYQHLPALLDWVRKQSDILASDNELGALLFAVMPDDRARGWALYDRPEAVELSSREKLPVLNGNLISSMQNDR